MLKYSSTKLTLLHPLRTIDQYNRLSGRSTYAGGLRSQGYTPVKNKNTNFHILNSQYLASAQTGRPSGGRGAGAGQVRHLTAGLRESTKLLSKPAGTETNDPAGVKTYGTSLSDCAGRHL